MPQFGNNGGEFSVYIFELTKHVGQTRESFLRNWEAFALSLTPQFRLLLLKEVV
jgi:hypothetical protein